MTTACIFNVMRFSTHDGPGIRTTVFFKGCPLACWWCHNPESQSFQPDRMHFPARCRLCLDCLTACPEHAISAVDGAIRTADDACTRCGGCTGVCLSDARQIVGRRFTVDELLAEVEKDTVFFDDSGGGVSLSGGEPLSQPAFVADFLAACRARGIHTVVETCGHARPGIFLNTALLANGIFFDLKLVDAAKHLRYTGVSNELILHNLGALLACHPAVTVRIPVVPAVNDTPADIAQFTAYLAGLRAPAVELLPYHPTGAAKYEHLGREYRLPSTPPPGPAALEHFRQTLSRAGLNVTIRG